MRAVILAFIVAISAVLSQDSPITHGRLGWSAVVNAPVEAVWTYIGDFANVTWIPGVQDSKVIYGADNEIGAIRQVNLGTNHYSYEKLYQYSIPSFPNTAIYRFEYQYEVMNITPGIFPAPLLNYLGTVTAQPIYDSNQTFVFWGLEYDTDWNLREVHGKTLFSTHPTSIIFRL